MGFDVTGGAEARYVALKLRKAAARDLTRELKAGYRAAVRPLQKEIKAEAAATLPKRGGYNAIMAKAVKVSVTGAGRTLTARIYARGKTEVRDVARINGGRLRHPTFGHRVFHTPKGDKSGWHDTRVRPGFVDRPIDRLVDKVVDEALNAAERVLEQIART